jgi:hypothetical protein
VFDIVGAAPNSVRDRPNTVRLDRIRFEAIERLAIGATQLLAISRR